MILQQKCEKCGKTVTANVKSGPLEFDCQYGEMHIIYNEPLRDATKSPTAHCPSD